MAGIFGNHPFDRAMEQQLNRYLSAGADYETYCEKVLDELPDTPEMNSFAESEAVDKILEENYLPFDATNDEYKTISAKIQAAFDLSNTAP